MYVYGLSSIPRLGVICGLSLLVLYSAPRDFSPGTPVFPSPQKPTFDVWYFIYSELSVSPYFGLSILVTNHLKDCAYQFRGIFAPFYDYAGNVDLNKCY